MTEDSIQRALERYAEAYCAKDIDALMDVFDASDNISIIGTGADELCVGRDAVRELFQRNFCEATANQFEWGWIDTLLSGDHAVVSVTLKIDLLYEGAPLTVPLRWTVVLRNEDNHWLWIHRHASSAASNQTVGQAYPKER